jgi:hypothetical protein
MVEIQKRFTKPDGKLRRGWSDDSIDRKIDQLEEMGLITGGRGRGEYYSVVEQPPSEAGVQPGNGAEGGAEAEPAKGEKEVLTHPHPQGLLGPAGNAGKFLDPHKPACNPQTANAGDSNKSRNGSDQVVETELGRMIREAKEQLQGKSSAA